MEWRDNIIYKVVAVLFAVLLWLYVSAEDNPPIEKTLTLDIVYENLSEELAVIRKDTEVSIKVRGDSAVVNNLGNKDFKASVDLSRAQIGENSLPVKISNLMGVEIIDIYPREVEVSIDRVAEKQIPVEVALLGQTAHGFSSFKATVKPSQVVVRGPETILKGIHEARVDVNLSNAEANLDLDLPVKIFDQKGNWYGSDLISVIPSTVEVFVPIVEDTPSKTVPVKPVFKGEPAAGYHISRIIIEPETVKILGSYDRLNLIDQMETNPISLSGLTESITREVNLSVPSGISLLYGNKVKVVVQIEKSTVVKEMELPIVIKDGSSKHKITVVPLTAKIKLEGQKDILENLTKDNFQAFVSVSGLEPGVYEINVQVDAPNNVQILETNPVKVKVEIKEKQESTETSSDEGNNN